MIFFNALTESWQLLHS